MAELEVPEGVLFTLQDIVYAPETPKMNEPFIVKGRVELLTLPFLAPIWVIVTVEYPETWWEDILPIIGAPQVREMAMVIGSDFEIIFSKGFMREGEFKLTTRVYAGPTFPIDKMTLPPFPPVATHETTFTVSGEVTPPEEVWEMVEEILGISIKAGGPVAAWEMVEEIPNIVIKHAPPLAIWEMVEEIPNIIIKHAPPVAIWEMVEEVIGIIVKSKPLPPVGWEMVEEISGIVVRAKAVVGYTLTIAVTPSGAGYVARSPDKPTYSAGERVTVTAHENPGYSFDYWAGVPGLPTTPTITLTMDEDKSIMAVFREIVPGLGTFDVYLTKEPISYKEFCVEWETTEGMIYIGSWATYYSLIKESSHVAGAYGEPISLTGRISAWLWDGTTSHKYGPSAYHALKDGSKYTFNLSDLVLYER